MDSGAICLTKRMEEITKEEIPEKFGDVYAKHLKVEEFILRPRGGARVIPAEELEGHDTALFEVNIEGGHYTLSDIMVDFDVDRQAGKVTAKKLWRYRGEYELETREYNLANYCRTWRAWTAVPTEDERRAAEWE